MLGSGLGALTSPLELCLLSENSGRAYRYCLARGTWQMLENSTDIWQDDSECSKDHSSEQNVSLLGLVMMGPGHHPQPPSTRAPLVGELKTEVHST